MKEPFIKAEKLSYQYNGQGSEGHPVLRELSVEIGEGEFVRVRIEEAMDYDLIGELVR